MSIDVTKFLTLTLKEIRSARAGDVPSPDDLADALDLFNEFLDLWNGNGRALYNVGFATFTLTPNHQPHTIGIAANTPDFTVTIGRPTSIKNGNIILPNNIRVPCRILTDEEWDSISAGAAAGQAITFTVSTPPDLYYSPGWPNGSIYLWPPPSIAYGLEIETSTLLSGNVAATDTLDLPFGYQSALRLSLAIYIASMWNQQVTPALKLSAQRACDVVFGNNEIIPNVCTIDAGMPDNRSQSRGRFNWLTGRVIGG